MSLRKVKFYKSERALKNMSDIIFFEEILENLQFLVTLIFGIILSAAFCGVERDKTSLFKMMVFTIVSAFLQLLTFKYWGADLSLQVYPLLIHLPLLLFLVLAYKIQVFSAALAISTAYLCCQITKWLAIFVVFFYPAHWVYCLVRILVVPFVLFVLLYYSTPNFALLTKRPMKEVAIFGLIPFTYYFYDYITTVYTKMLYSGNALVVEFLGFFLCITYIIFLNVFAKEYIAKNELAAKNKLIELKINSTLHELTQTRYAQYQMSIMRHDMRHFISTTYALIQQQKYTEAMKYLANEQSELESIILHRYCTNEYINAILAKYDDKCRLKHIQFKVEVKIPAVLSCAEISFSTILENALENAYEAVRKLPEEKAQIYLSLKQNNDKLLLSIKNTYLHKPEFVNDVPISHCPGHGIGTQSIIYNCDKIGGQCQFVLEKDLFVLRVIV